MLLSVGIFRLGWKIKRKPVCTKNACRALSQDRESIKAKATSDEIIQSWDQLKREENGDKGAFFLNE